MKFITDILFFLIIAAALGSQARRIHDFSHPADCCLSYTSRRIRCTSMKDYFMTSSSCSRPGIIFITKKGQHVCVNPKDSSIQDCVLSLSLNSGPQDLGKLKIA
ncbi:C-C motif chemokine 14-like [Ctenodactylus gundi]